MSDDRKDGPPPVAELPPFFPMVQDDSAIFGSQAHRAYALSLDTFRSQARRAYALSLDTGVFGPPLPPVEAAPIPSLLLQTVIVRGARTSEGTLIEAVALPWFDIIAFLKADPSIAFQLPPEKWEEIIAGAYKKAGFEEVTLTPRSGDYGRDVIAIKKGIGTIRVIDQVKAYKPSHLVTANDVRALIGVLHGDGAAKACLSTTSDFAPMIKKDPTIVQYIPSRLDLVNGAALFAKLEEIAAKPISFAPATA
jgi:restriction system protein